MPTNFVGGHYAEEGCGFAQAKAAQRGVPSASGGSVPGAGGFGRVDGVGQWAEYEPATALDQGGAERLPLRRQSVVNSIVEPMTVVPVRIEPGEGQGGEEIRIDIRRGGIAVQNWPGRRPRHLCPSFDSAPRLCQVVANARIRLRQTKQDMLENILPRTHCYVVFLPPVAT